MTQTYVFKSKVLHEVLCPEVHKNGFKKKKKRYGYRYGRFTHALHKHLVHVVLQQMRMRSQNAGGYG